MAKIPAEKLRKLLESPTLAADLQKAYASIRYAYACLELEMLEAISFLQYHLVDPNVRALVRRYAERIVHDSNFLQAMRSPAVVDRKLARLKVPHEREHDKEKAMHEALAKMVAFLNGTEFSDEEAFDFNMLQHMKRNLYPFSMEPQRPGVFFGEPPEPLIELKQFEKEVAKLQKEQKKHSKIVPKNASDYMRIRTKSGLKTVLRPKNRPARGGGVEPPAEQVTPPSRASHGSKRKHRSRPKTK